MPCYNCSTEFGLLKKEVGCEKCGFSFCSKCCKKQNCSLGNEDRKMTVCNQCYKILTGETTHSTSKGSPPLAHRKRMEALKKKSMSVDSASHVSLHSLCSNTVDKNLAERLQKLKRDRIKADLPSEDEIKVRLAKLKGMDPSAYTAPPIQVYRPVEKLTSEQQVGKLIQQFAEEVQIDSNMPKPEDEIAERLARLRDQEPVPKAQEFNIPPNFVKESSEDMQVEDVHSMLQEESRNAAQLASEEIKVLNTDEDYRKLLTSMREEKEIEESENDEEEADKLVKKLLETGTSDDMDDLELNDLNSEKPEEQADEELPWCVICTEDARIRCFGCEGDLYCSRCYKDCHDSLDIKDHKTCPFLPPKVPVL